MKCTINLIGKSDKNDNNKERKSKYFINEALEILNPTLSNASS